ncbi:MAG TPA: hypothetical protein VNB90_12675 [Cytophagaceae bacterium]|jgi:hypothetical protein|nr:hypothetical protein [Cytophagaceae bacterium]
MKKIIYLVMALALIATPSMIYAQDAATTKGDFLLDVGVGFWGGYVTGYNPGNFGDSYSWNDNGTDSHVQIPTLSLTLQKAFWDDITIGGQFAINAYGSTHDVQQGNGYYQHSRYTQTNMFFLGRGEYHFNRLIGWGPKYDLYAGALAGVRVSTAAQTQIYEGNSTTNPPYRTDYPDRRSGSAGPNGGVVGGIRYYFVRNTSVFAEAGVGINFIRVGLNWRL